jgi:hypothetical protein
MQMLRSGTLLTLLMLVSTACDGPTAIDGSELPAPDLSTDPARIRVGRVIASPCGNGSVRDTVGPLLVDIHFGRTNAGGGPSSEDIRSVQRQGGRVLFLFGVPAVRARIDTDGLRQLVKSVSGITVYDVPDPTRYDLSVIVVYGRPIEDLDLARIAELGGRIFSHLNSNIMLGIELPQRSIRPLRISSGVRHAGLNQILCLGAG